MPLILATTLLAACASRAATPTTRPTPGISGIERLHAELQTVFTDAKADRAQWSVGFYSLLDGKPLYRLNPSRLMVPASVQKMLTTAVAAERLGWDFRYTTRLLSTAPIGSDGTIDGDLVVVSNGDPSINPRHPERWRAFDDWAAALKARGVRIISGRLIGDDNAFAEPAWGFGWSWDDLHYGYGAEPSALQYNENAVEVMVGPSVDAGSRAIISTSPLGNGLVVDHGVTTVAAGEPTRLAIARMPNNAFLAVRGQIAADAAPVKLEASAENPTRFYVTALREALARNGIFVAGGVMDVDESREPLRHDTLHELLVDRSPPLAQLIDVTLKWSRNIYAESMLQALAPTAEPATGASGLESVRETLRQWEVPDDSYIARDGSGLSRYNYVTGDAVIKMLTHIWGDSRHAEMFQSALPVAGISGTLANRMKGTVAEGRVRGKTGTMSHIRSLAGYLTTLNGEPIVFSLIANDFRVPGSEIDAVMDDALTRVVQFQRAPRD